MGGDDYITTRRGRHFNSASTAIELLEAELTKAEARIAELESTCAELVTDGNAITLAANLARQSARLKELAMAAKRAVSTGLLAALSGEDKSLRTEDGFIRWGLVENRIHAAIDGAAAPHDAVPATEVVDATRQKLRDHPIRHEGDGEAVAP